MGATTVAEIMTPDPEVVLATEPLDEVARRMRDQNIGDVIVERNDQICGLVTDRDIVIRALTRGTDLSEVRVGDICSQELFSVSPKDSTDRAVDLMREHAIRRLPVIDNGQAVGVISLGDLAIERDGKSALADISSAPPNI